MIMEAKVLRCSACGALIDEDSVSCPYCGATLARTACSNCFALAPVNAKHCPSCGTPIKDEIVSRPEKTCCPGCKTTMESSLLGGVEVNTCARCGGIWLNRDAFENLSASRRQRGLVIMGIGSDAESSVPETSITYRPCPVCGRLMNRINYVRISGVILDICKSHGVWFDRDELRRVLSFIEKGGLLKAQEREKMKLKDARRDANSETNVMPMGTYTREENL